MAKLNRDRLEVIIEKQRNFHELVGPSLVSASKSKREEMLAKTCRNIIVESVELMQSINWKEWKKEKKEVNWKNTKEELIDVFIFTINGLLEAGMDTESIYQEFIRKVEINEKRQKENY